MQAFRFVLPRARRVFAFAILVLCLLCATPPAGIAAAQAPLSKGSLATSPVLAAGTHPGSTAPAKPAQLDGQVTDGTGALVPGARVDLRRTGSPVDRTTDCDKEGHFAFADLPPGEYVVAVSAAGFEPFTSAPVSLRPGEDRRLEDLSLRIPADHADAYVTLNQKQIAAAELHAAEQQRIVGFPDFYTSFVWNAAPMNAAQKLSLGLHATTDRMAFVTAGLVASGEQIKGTFPEFGGGVRGFGKRYGAAYADGFTGKFLGGAILPSLFRQDPRYFYMGANGTVKQRVRHAVLSAFLARGDNGHTELNYSHILGNAGAGALSTLYHPAADSAGKLALDNALLGTLGEAGVNVVRELFLKRFVRGGDVEANGMPPR